MTDANSKGETPTLEMRLAAIEDKLSRMTITEEEMAAYNKVAGLVAARTPAAASPTLSPRTCSIGPITPIFDCWVFVRPPTITPVIVNDCIQFQAGPASTGAG